MNRPAFATVTSADFARSIRWAKTWRNPISERIKLELAKIKQGKKK